MASVAATPTHETKEITFKDPSSLLQVSTPTQSGRSSRTASSDMTPPALGKAVSEALEAAHFHLEEAAAKQPPLLPQTPRPLREAFKGFSPPGAPKSSTTPPLMSAMRADDEHAVRAVLDEDPAAATDLFWEHGAEPPLCWAVRKRCCPGIVRLLLEHSADVDVADPSGQTPLSILGSTCNLRPFDSLDLFTRCSMDLGWVQREAPGLECKHSSRQVKEQLEVSKLLTEAGADPMTVDGAGDRPLDLAAIHGNEHLVRLWCNISDARGIVAGALPKLGAAGDVPELGLWPW